MEHSVTTVGHVKTAEAARVTNSAPPSPVDALAVKVTGVANLLRLVPSPAEPKAVWERVGELGPGPAQVALEGILRYVEEHGLIPQALHH